ncbi:MAG: hypothetical protein EXR75_04655 [Myxococcales bacterium]|nr:hypothetical protein [Myxococcales bacterium]
MKAWAVPCLVAASALAFDPRVPAAIVKTPALLLAALGVLAFNWSRARLTVGAVLLASTAAWLMLSSAWAEHPDPLRFAPLCASALIAIAIGGLSQELRRTLAIRVATIVCLANGVVSLGQLFLGLSARGLQGNPNWLGLELAVALPLVWHGLRDREARTNERRLAALAMACGLAGLIASDSRTGWLALLVGVCVLEHRRLRWLALAVGLGGFAYAALRGDLLASAKGRLWLAEISLAAAADAMPLGTGLGDFPFAFLDSQGKRLFSLDVREAATQFSNAVTAHDDVLELLATAGPVALFLFVATLAAGFIGRGPKVSVRDGEGTSSHAQNASPARAVTAKDADGSPSHAQNASPARAVTAAVAITALGDSALSLPVVALALAYAASDTPRISSRPRDRWLTATALAMASLVLALAVARYGSQLVLASGAQAIGPARLAILERAVALDARDGEAWLALGLAHDESGDAERAAVALERSTALLANVGAFVALGNAQYDRDPEAAIVAYRRALGWHPGSFRARLNLARARMRDGQLQDAADALELAQRLMPTHAKAMALAEELRRAQIDEATK